ncbi:MAG: ABC transporter permease, partial [Anaerolineae bacterium]|nr:ABC transporter permease [Anaerolineae bacterium]
DKRIDRDTAIRLESIDGLAGIEVLNQLTVRYKTQPEAEWKPGVLVMRDDYHDMKYDLLQLKAGEWPERSRSVGIDRSASDFYGIDIGDEVIFELDQTDRALQVTGKIRHPFVPPPAFGGEARFFVDGQGLERFGVEEGEFSELLVQVEPYSQPLAEEVATEIKDRLAKEDIGVTNVIYQDPTEHWGRIFIEGFNFVLQILAVVSLIVSAILVTNTLTALITQQTNQIGIIKAVGGKTSVILKIYLSAVFVYGVLAFLISVAPGAYVAFSLTKTFLNLFNIDYDTFHISPVAIELQAGAALLTPLIAALLPILKGTATTVREAIASYGIAGSFGNNSLDRAVDRLSRRFLSSSYAISLNNMFRKKGRLILTQLVLITAGTMFLVVISLAQSTDLTVTNDLNRRHYDVRISFEDRQRADRVTRMAKQLPEVVDTEVWLTQSGSLLKAGQRLREAGIGIVLNGIPIGSQMFQPIIVAGRWLQPADENALVIYQEIAEDHHINVGDTVTVDLGEFGDDTWQVVGIFQTVFADGFGGDPVYAPLTAVENATNKHNRGTQILVRTQEQGEVYIAAVSDKLKTLYENRQRDVDLNGSGTTFEDRQFADSQYAININMLLALAAILALVGGIGLMGALSISVVERTREIGVMRAVGARTRTILGMLIMEGVLQGTLSWAVAVPLSFLLGRPMAQQMGQIMLNINLDYAYSYGAVLVWLGMVLSISTLASVLPARSATQISVRESLAYA